MLSVLQSVALLIICAAIYVIALAIQRLYFSPLSRFPGPKLAAATLWYEFYYNIVLDGQFIWEIERMHQVYGKIVRINPYELHIMDPEVYDDIYAGGAKKRDKYPWFTAGGGSPQSIFETEHHDQHRLRRSVLNPFFSKRSIVSIEPLIKSQISSLVKLLQNRMAHQRLVEFRTVYSSLTLDIISSYCFGDSWHCLEDEELAEKWKDLLHSAFEKAALIMHFPWILRMMHRLPSRITGDLIVHYRNTQRLVGAILNHHDDESKSQDTIFHTLRDSDLPPVEKTLNRLSDEGNILIGAGSETTAQILAVLSFHLINNPNILHKMQQELQTVMPEKDSPVSWNQLEQLPYLSAVVAEGLRVSSPVTIRLPRVAPNETITYGQWAIPPGTPVSMSYYFLHYDPIVFPQPKKFHPERWMVEEEERKRLERYMVPFSKGSRICIGINLAYAELYLAIATIFRRFDFELVETDESDVEIYRDCFVGQPRASSKGVRVMVVGERE